jgi:hypothetical protein
MTNDIYFMAKQLTGLSTLNAPLGITILPFAVSSES